MDVFEASPSPIYRLHEGWDAFPISANKMEINALTREKERAEMIFPFSLYHSGWNELVSELFIRKRYYSVSEDPLNSQSEKTNAHWIQITAYWI